MGIKYFECRYPPRLTPCVKYATTPHNCWTRYPPRYSNGWAEFWSEPMKLLVDKLNHTHWLRIIHKGSIGAYTLIISFGISHFFFSHGNGYLTSPSLPQIMHCIWSYLVQLYTLCHIFPSHIFQFIVRQLFSLFIVLTGGNWQNEKEYSWHVPAMKFIGMKQLV